MKATLYPKQYLITYDLNAEGDTVTGMDDFLLTYTDENDQVVVTDIYGVIHTWSFDTAINAVPQREGYIFQGWQADVAEAYVDGNISAANYQDVVLTAKWVRDCFTVVTETTTGGTATGDGVYDRGETATVIATPSAGYIFKGWYLGSTKYDFSKPVTGNITLKAKWEKIAAPEDPDVPDIPGDSEEPGMPVPEGWILENGNWVFYENGEKVTNQWRKDSIGWCYLGADGVMKTNCWLQDSQGWCYIGADGYCETNCWKQDSYGWLYLNSEGSMTKSKWVFDEGYWYYLDEEGYMVTGQHTIDGEVNYFDDFGIWIG